MKKVQENNQVVVPSDVMNQLPNNLKHYLINQKKRNQFANKASSQEMNQDLFTIKNGIELNSIENPKDSVQILSDNQPPSIKRRNQDKDYFKFHPSTSLDNSDNVNLQLIYDLD